MTAQLVFCFLSVCIFLMLRAPYGDMGEVSFKNSWTKPPPHNFSSFLLTIPRRFLCPLLQRFVRASGFLYFIIPCSSLFPQLRARFCSRIAAQSPHPTTYSSFLLTIPRRFLCPLLQWLFVRQGFYILSFLVPHYAPNLGRGFAQEQLVKATNPQLTVVFYWPFQGGSSFLCCSDLFVRQSFYMYHSLFLIMPPTEVSLTNSWPKPQPHNLQ